MCILYIYVCLLLDLMKGGPLKIHFKYLYLFICCPPNPVLLLEVFVHSEHQGGLISSPKKHLSPSWTFPMHLQLQSLRLPNSNCCMLSSCDSQPNNFSILRVDFFGGSGKHRGKSKDNFLGGADWFSFKKKGTIFGCQIFGFYKFFNGKKNIWTNHRTLHFFWWEPS